MPDTYFCVKLEVLLPDQGKDMQNLMMDEISSEAVLEHFESIAQAFFSAVAGESIKVYLTAD